jgi:integrase
MASLYRKPVIVTDPKTGQRVKSKSKKWWGRYKDENGIECRVPLAVDKTAAQTMLNELVRKTERRAAGLIDRFDEHRQRPIDVHLEEFRKHLQARRVGEAQVKLVGYRVERIIEACRVRILTDLSASRVQKFLADLRADGLSIQTSNHYLRAIKQFSRWLVRDRRAGEDPLAYISMLNVATDRRHDRRPLTETEFTALIAATKAGKTIVRLKGPDRAMLYIVAAYTGLRASELASLTPESFRLDETPPTVTVLAGYSKHRRQDILPLHPSLVESLRPWLGLRKPATPVWPGAWARAKQAGKTLQRDLKAADIPYIDKQGRYADFHALRHTFITNMMKSGINPKTAQSLARHSTIDLTMNVYTSLTVNDQAAAIAALPGLKTPNPTTGRESA